MWLCLAWIAGLLIEASRLAGADGCWPDWLYDELAATTREHHAAWLGIPPEEAEREGREGRALWEEIDRLIARVTEECGKRFEFDGDPVALDPTILMREADDWEDRRELAAMRDAAAWGMKELDSSGLFEKLDRLAEQRLLVVIDPPDWPRWSCKTGMGSTGRKADRACRAQMERAADARDWAEYRRMLRHRLALARHSWWGPSLIGRLIGDAHAKGASCDVLRDVMNGRLPGTECAAVLEVVEQGSAYAPDSLVMDSLLLDFRAMLDLMHTGTEPDAYLLPGHQRLVQDGLELPMKMITGVFDRALAGVPIKEILENLTEGLELPDISWTWLENTMGVWKPRRGESETLLRACLLRAADVLSVSPADADDERAELERWIREACRGNVAVESMMLFTFSAFDRTTDSGAMARVSIEGLRGVLAIEAFRASNGRLPGSLAELVPRWVSRAPDEVFGPGPLKYRVLDGEEMKPGRGYVLYSVWSDGVDDGGARVPPKGRDARYFDQWTESPRWRDGLDLIMNDVLEETDAKSEVGDEPGGA